MANAKLAFVRMQFLLCDFAPGCTSLPRRRETSRMAGVSNELDVTAARPILFYFDINMVPSASWQRVKDAYELAHC
jgi:hypothetical protein